MPGSLGNSHTEDSGMIGAETVVPGRFWGMWGEVWNLLGTSQSPPTPAKYQHCLDMAQTLSADRAWPPRTAWCTEPVG